MNPIDCDPPGIELNAATEATVLNLAHELRLTPNDMMRVLVAWGAAVHHSLVQRREISVPDGGDTVRVLACREARPPIPGRPSA
ncbi:hypothetical protein [Streptoalloteichus hindustanus]|uniref:Uncharacterized protein n=1 Tax=Streptoalloteichus hindustanus TaxID=2017 RepID=A0A1M5PCS6_STRHI|nr:hypothetical protein [Streptoalloteichus hindustanus]SHG99528.1 hypothetical protein SAMN05444320_11811 [Streptoalloteichus hindustanus]